jgi:molybdopterin molybdotransferase
VRPLSDAQRDVLAAMRPLPAAEVPLGDALGLVTAVPVHAPHDVPPFANSAVDGYAVRAADTVGGSVRLPVLEDVPAGSVPARTVEAGTAIRIMTGAPLPGGADAVVRVEDTETDGEAVVIHREVGSGTAVRDAGGDVGAGDEVFPAGERLTAHHLGVLAALGVVRPVVRRRPVVAILSTGDEVVPPETDVPAPGAIRDANRPALAAMLGGAGAVVRDFGIVGDDADRLRAVLDEAAGGSDAVVTSGGVSMGDYDLVKEVLGGLGGVQFWQVAMQPGKPFAFGRLGATPFFGLPGNPVSVAVAFEQFVRPALLHRMGARFVFRPRVRGTLAEAVSTEGARTVFLRVRAEYRDGTWVAAPSGGQSSNMLAALARADAFAVIPAGIGDVAAGTEVDLEMFRWPERRTMEEVLGG